MCKSAIFLDRDGTIIHDLGYINNPENVTLIDGIVHSLRMFQSIGFLLIIISNQAGVGKGIITIEEFQNVHNKVVSILEKEDIILDSFRYCPHKKEDNCSCRKPSPEMILSTADEFDINLSSSFMIGDRLTDIECGKNAGCKTILLNNNFEDISNINSDFIASDWKEIENYIWMKK